jgi:transcriptional regulator with XRE-family HTH domain
MTTQDILASSKTLGEVLRRLREHRNMSLRQLAMQVKVSAPFLSDVEHNRRSTDKLPEISSALDVPLDELKRFDKRLSTSLRQWMTDNPELAAFLDEYRESGKPVDRLLHALRASSRRDQRVKR